MPPPTLSPAQEATFAEIARREDGAWARAFFDGTAEVFSAHRGGLRRFVLDADGSEIESKTIPPTARVRRGRVIALGLLALGAVGGIVAWQRPAGADSALLWLWPSACVAALMITLAYCFGIYSRLPPPRFDAGEWTALPGPEEGDGSGHTLPGFLKANPFFAALWLFLPLVGGFALAREKLPLGGGSGPAGAAIGIFLWWFMMLCFSRGWIKEGD